VKPTAIPQNNAVMPDKRENRGHPLARTPLRSPPVAQVAAFGQEGKVDAREITTPMDKIGPPVVDAAIPTVGLTSDNNTLFTQLKSFLAVIGVLALFIHGLKILGKAAG
jgi:hypothetical protein